MVKPMTDDELRATPVPEGCYLAKVIDHLDEDGPIGKLFIPIRTPEEEAVHRAMVQAVLDRIYTNHCIRLAAQRAAGQD